MNETMELRTVEDEIFVDVPSDPKVYPLAPPPLVTSGEIGSEPRMVLFGSSQQGVPQEWKTCVLQCIMAWLVYLCRGVRPADKKLLETWKPRVMEIVNRVLNGRINHDRGIMEVVPEVYTSDMSNPMRFTCPNLVSDAMLALFGVGPLITLGREWAWTCCQKIEVRTTTVTCLWEHVKSTQNMSFAELVRLKLEQPPNKRCKCASCGIDSVPTFQSIISLPMFLSVFCDFPLDFTNGDSVVLPGGALYDIAAVFYIGATTSSRSSETDEMTYIIIMRGNENPHELYMYDSRSMNGAFVALQGGVFPYHYTSVIGSDFYARHIILKHRCGGARRSE